MDKKPDIRSFWNPVPRLGEAAQKSVLTGELYGPTQRDALIRSVRPGSVVEVAELYLLAKADLRADARRNDLLKTMAAIEGKPHFGIVVEASTGRRSDNPKQSREMLAHAFKQISTGGKGRHSAVNGALSKGAPGWLPTPEEKAICSEEWFSKKNATIDDACIRIKGRLGKRAPSRTTLYKHLGSPYASGQ